MEKRKKVMIVVIPILGILSILGIVSYAYMTDCGSLDNHFTTASFHISVEEPEYEKLPDSDHDGRKDEATGLHQGSNITKDPCIRNLSSVDAWLFAVITVPVKEVRTVSSAPDCIEIPLFTYEYDAQNWIQMEQKKTAAAVTTIYAYNRVVSAGGQTEPIFTGVTYADVVEGEIPDTEILEITVDGYGIQAEGFSNLEDAYNSRKWEVISYEEKNCFGSCCRYAIDSYCSWKSELSSRRG